MKKFFLCLFLITSVVVSCDKESAKLPPCIQEWIDVVLNEPRWNPAAEVKEFDYNGRRVFLLSSNCCDGYNTLVDGNCRYICAPSGGIAGGGDRKCTDFNARAKFIRQVWKDRR